MQNKKDLEAAMPDIRALSPDAVHEPDIPAKDFTQGAEQVYIRATECRAAFENSLLDWNVADKIPVYCGALRQLTSSWTQINLSQPEKQLEWIQLRSEAEDIRYELIAAMRHAFSKKPQLMEKLSVVGAYSTNAEFIQGMNDIAMLAEDNLSLLQRIKDFDTSLIEWAADLSARLAELLAQATVDRSTSPEAKDLRDRAYTLLKMAVDELCEAAQYVFRRDTGKAALFTVQYHPRKRKKQETKKETAAIA